MGVIRDSYPWKDRGVRYFFLHYDTDKTKASELNPHVLFEVHMTSDIFPVIIWELMVDNIMAVAWAKNMPSNNLIIANSSIVFLEFLTSTFPMALKFHLLNWFDTNSTFLQKMKSSDFNIIN